jgi:hypothetical protein
MTPEEFSALVEIEKEKRRRVLERAYIGEDGLQHILKIDQQVDLHRHIRDWLMSHWDPIGVSDMPQAINEYSAYEREVADLLQAANEQELAKRLNKLATEHMGLTRELVHDQAAARKLFASFRAWVRNLDQENAP